MDNYFYPVVLSIFHFFINYLNDYKTNVEQLKQEKILKDLNFLLKILEQKFENWFAETGGKTNLDAKIENTTKAKNDLRIQLTSLDNLKDLLIDKYDPTVAGVLDGPIQAIQEITGMNSTLSAAHESNMSRATSCRCASFIAWRTRMRN